MNKIYFDNAATTHMHDEVIEAMVSGMKANFGNPSSTHFFGRETKGIIENTRKTIAQATGVSSGEIIFTSCGTEANNLILRSCVEHLGVKRIITSKLEHSCVMETTQSLKENQGIEIVYVKNDDKGNIDLQHLEELLKSCDKKTVVSLMHANNEIANINPIEKIGELVHANNALFHCDMVQTLGHFIINLNDLPVDFASSSAHKFHGPKGVGFAYIRKDTGLKAQITGGGQERNMRSGTENVHGILGLGKAFELSQKKHDESYTYIKDLKQYTIQQLKAAIPNIVFNGNCEDLDNSLYVVLSISLPFSSGMLGFELDLKGIAASQGSACQSGATKASRVLSQLYAEDFLSSTTPLRISFSVDNTKEEVDTLVETLKELNAKYSN